jgi:hypothetical protein
MILSQGAAKNICLQPEIERWSLGHPFRGLVIIQITFSSNEGFRHRADFYGGGLLTSDPDFLVHPLSAVLSF